MPMIPVIDLSDMSGKKVGAFMERIKSLDQFMMT